MGFTANEVKDWAHNAVSMIPHVEWFHGWELTYRTNALSLVKEDVVIVLSESIMKFCRVTSSTKPSEARRRIEEHMTIGFDGSDMLINIDGGEGSGLHTYTVPLRCWVDKEDETRVASQFKFDLKYKVEAYHPNQGAEQLRKFGKFTSKWPR